MRSFLAFLLLLGLTATCTAGAGPGLGKNNRQGGEVIADPVGIFSLNYDDDGDTMQLRNDYDEQCPDSSESPDGVYSYTNDTGAPRSLRIDLAGSYFDTKVYVYAETGRDLVLIDCNDDRADKADCGGGTSLIEDLPVPEGQRIYIIVDGSHNAGGMYHISVTDPYAGACCLGDGTCLFLNPEGCEVQDGDFLGAGTACDPNPCEPPTGACCFRNAVCRILTGPHCVGLRGVYLGDDISCEPNPCPPANPIQVR